MLLRKKRKKRKKINGRVERDKKKRRSGLRWKIVEKIRRTGGRVENLREWQRGSFELDWEEKGLSGGERERDTVKCWKTSQLMVFDFHSNYHSSGSVHSQSGPILYPRHIPEMISWPTAFLCCPRSLLDRQREFKLRCSSFSLKQRRSGTNNFEAVKSSSPFQLPLRPSAIHKASERKMCLMFRWCQGCC